MPSSKCPASFPHSAYEKSGPTELLLPPNIHEILDSALIPAEELNALHGMSEKFFVEDHPGLFVRLIRGEPVDGTNTAIEAGNRLRQYGISVLPSRVVEHDGEAFVVTNRVTGQDLVETPSLRGNASLVEDADKMWKGLVANIVASRQNGDLVATDVEMPHQYMHGTIPRDRITRIRLVDLAQFVNDPANSIDAYAELLLKVANGVSALEKASDGSMPLARKAIELACAPLSNDNSWPGKVLRATQYVLKHNDHIDPHDVGSRFPKQ